MQKTYNEIAGQRIQRIEAISDGVFAFALTLLVLDLKVPIDKNIKTEGELFAAFCQLMPMFLTYFLSFMTIGIFWTGHSTQYSYIIRSDRHLNWINLFLLLFVTLLPFTTAFLSQHIGFKLAVGVYWFNIFMLGVLTLSHWVYAYRHNYVDIPHAEKEGVHKAIWQRVVIAQTLYAAGALLCFVNIYLSIGVIILVQLNYALALFSRIGNGKRRAT